MESNVLYFMVLPMIHLTDGTTEQVLTLSTDKNSASQFFKDEVDDYIVLFKNRVRLLTGGHVKGYEIHPEPTDDGRVTVRVVQNVG